MSDTTKLIADARQAADALEEYEFEDHASEAAGLLNGLADALIAAETELDESEEARLASDLQVARLTAASLPREATTVEELDALPAYTVVRDDTDEVYEKAGHPSWSPWRGIESTDNFFTGSINLPARILFAPSVTPGGEEQG